MLSAIVQIVALAFDHQQEFLEDVPMLTAPFAWGDFLRHQIQPVRRHLGPPADVKLNSSLPAIFPGTIRSANHARTFSLDAILLGEPG